MSDTEYVIKKQQRFDAELAAAIPHFEIREDVERAIRFALKHFPENGVFTGRSAPVPVFAWPLHATPRNPALLIYYCFSGTTVLLMSVKVSEPEDDDL